MWSFRALRLTTWHCFFLRAEQLCFEMNAYGRTFHHGKSIEKYMTSLIIDDIMSGGRNVSTQYYPLTGSFRATRSKYKLSGLPVSNAWKTFCQMRENLPLHAAARGQPRMLAEPQLAFGQLLIKCRPSENLTYKSIKENIEAQSMATLSISTYRPCCPRPLTRRENDLGKDDEASRQNIHHW